MKYSILILFTFLIFIGCEVASDPLDCESPTICTEEFVTFTYSPKDNEGQTIVLDAFYAQNMDNGNIYDDFQEQKFLNSGVYIIITDAEMNEVHSKGTTIRFFGQKGGQVIIQEDFLVGHDCCHIVPLEGP